MLQEVLDIRAEDIGGDSDSKLHHEDHAKQHGKRDDHTVVLLDGAAASEESNHEDEDPHGNEDGRGGDEAVRDEVQV